MKEWRNEYDHPSLVTKSRRKEENLENKIINFDNWENYLVDPNFRQSWI